MEIQALVERLREATAASRVTLRRDTPGQVFPVACESLAPGVSSIRQVLTPNMAGQPVVLRVLAGEQVVQNDSATEFPHDEPFHAMRELYGGLRAQIVTPVVRNGRTVGIVSVHDLRDTRAWTDVEIALCRDTADRLAGALGGQA